MLHCTYLYMFTGYYCPEGVDPVGCPAGTYNNFTRRSILASCLDCPAGYVQCVIKTHFNLYHDTLWYPDRLYLVKTFIS